jgi:hypothetical protein
MKSDKVGEVTPVKLICMSSCPLLIVSAFPLPFAYTTVLPPTVTTSIVWGAMLDGVEVKKLTARLTAPCILQFRRLLQPAQQLKFPADSK